MKKKRYIEKMFGGGGKNLTAIRKKLLPDRVTIRNCYEDSRINTGRKEIFYGNF